MAAAAVIQGYLERMMKLSYFLKRGALNLLLGVLIWTTAVAAQSADNVSRRDFEAQGVMRYLDLPAGTVLIDDKLYRLASNVQWYGLDPNVSKRRQLLNAANRRVGFVVDSRVKTPTVSAIQIFPLEGR